MRCQTSSGTRSAATPQRSAGEHGREQDGRGQAEDSSVQRNLEARGLDLTPQHVRRRPAERLAEPARHGPARTAQRLERGIHEGDQEPTPRRQHAVETRESRLGLGEPVEGLGRDHGVEAAVGEGQTLRVPLREGKRAAAHGRIGPRGTAPAWRGDIARPRQPEERELRKTRTEVHADDPEPETERNLEERGEHPAMRTSGSPLRSSARRTAR